MGSRETCMIGLEPEAFRTVSLLAWLREWTGGAHVGFCTVDMCSIHYANYPSLQETPNLNDIF